MQSTLVDRYARRVAHARGSAWCVGAKADGDPGEISGYAATWDVDRQREQFVKGAFLRSIQQKVAAGKVKLMARHFAHGGDALECIGTIVEAKEDAVGLWIRAKLASTQIAQDVRTLVKEMHVQGLSVGFYPVEWKEHAVDGADPILQFTEVELAEVTVTVKPVNEHAGITGAKSDPPETPESTTDDEGKQPGAPTPPVEPESKSVSALPRLAAHLDLCRKSIESLRL